MIVYRNESRRRRGLDVVVKVVMGNVKLVAGKVAASAPSASSCRRKEAHVV